MAKWIYYDNGWARHEITGDLYYFGPFTGNLTCAPQSPSNSSLESFEFNTETSIPTNVLTLIEVNEVICCYHTPSHSDCNNFACLDDTYITHQ